MLRHATNSVYSCKDNNISLNELLKEHINVTNTKKFEISQLMKKDECFWEQRPLTQDMIEYAAQDVIYLPLVYEKMFEQE